MVIRLARLIACIIVVAAVFLLRESPGVTTWSALLLLAVLVFLGAEHEQGAWVETTAGKANVPAFMDIAADHSIPEPAQHRLTASEHVRGSYEPESVRSPHVDEAEPYATVSPVDDDDLQEVQVDEVLMRIHQHGLGSLSDSDRAILERASRKYRQRIGS
jgi:hypothetical protein